jgi:hypothetical protein
MNKISTRVKSAQINSRDGILAKLFQEAKSIRIGTAFAFAVFIALSWLFNFPDAESIEEYELLNFFPPDVVDENLTRQSVHNVKEYLMARIGLFSASGNITDYTIIVEVRRLDSGITIFLSTLSNDMVQADGRTFLTRWTADEPGVYQIRTFALSDLDRPHILSSVKTSEVAILATITEPVIRMEKGPSDFSSPAYSIEIYENRMVIFYGHDYIATPGTHVTEISQEKLDSLLNEFENINFFSLDETYGEVESDGGMTIEISVNSDGKNKTITFGSGVDVPKELFDLVDRIDQDTEISKWVLCSNSQPPIEVMDGCTAQD